MNFKVLPLIAFLIILLVSCKKESDINEGSLIKRTVQTSLYQPTTTVDTFLYDTQKRLTGIRYLDTNSKYDIQIEYDAQGRFSKIGYGYMGRENYSCSFVYNSRGQIINKLTVPSPGFDYAYDESYGYDDMGRVTSDTTYYKQTDSVLYFITFTYDNNGNVLEDDFRNFIDPVNQGKTFYTFDSNPNPFYIQGSNYFYLTGNSSYLSKNNIITSKPWWSGIISTEFEYQRNGLPKKFTTTGLNGNRSTFEIEYW
jgi:hypothetical protein